jgi:hypothetical protein
VLAVTLKSPIPLAALASAAVAWAPISLVQRGTKGRALVDVLVRTGRFQLAFGVALAVCVVVTRRIR